MKNNRTLILAFCLASAAFPASAQFSKLKGLAMPSESSSAPADGAMQEALVQRFVASQALSLQAQSEFAQAFGLAEQLQQLEAERIALSSGAVGLDQMKKAVSVSEAVQAAIDERVAAQPELDAEAKAHYTQGLVALLQSVAEGRQLVAEARNFTSGMQGAGALQLANASRKLASGFWVAKESPAYLKNLYGSTRSALTFARAAKIKTPDNAEAMLDDL